MIDRLRQFIEFKGVSIAAFEQKISASDGMIRRAIRNKTDIQSKWIEKMWDNYPDLNLHWLFTGEGPMCRTYNKHECIESSVEDSNSSYKAIPHLPISAEAGAFNGDVSVGERDCSYYIVPSLQGADFMITVRGDSMSPSFMPGDIIACKRIENESYIQWGRVYLLDTDQGPIVKRIKPSNKDGTVLITSDNPDYASFDLEQKSIRKMALVLGLIRPE